MRKWKSLDWTEYGNGRVWVGRRGMLRAVVRKALNEKWYATIYLRRELVDTEKGWTVHEAMIAAEQRVQHLIDN